MGMGRSGQRGLAVLVIAGLGLVLTACGDDDDDAAPAATDGGGDNADNNDNNDNGDDNGDDDERRRQWRDRTSPTSAST